MLRFADHTTDIGDILQSVVEDGEVRVSLGKYAGQNETSLGVSSDAPVWQQTGFASRPADPDERGSAMAVYVLDGDQKRVVATRDNRNINLIAELLPGESIVFGQNGNFLRLHQDGRISMFTTEGNDPTGDGASVSATLDPEDGGSWTVNIKHGKLVFDKLGFRVVHSGGGRLSLGGMGAPAPFNQLSSYCQIQAGMINLNGLCSLGTTAGAANDAAIQATVTFTNALVAAIATISTASPGATAMTSGPFLAALAAYLTAVQNLGKFS